MASQSLANTRTAVTYVVAQHADGRIVRSAYPSRLDAEVRLALIAEDNRQAMIAAGFPEYAEETDDRAPVHTDRLPGNFIRAAVLETAVVGSN